MNSNDLELKMIVAPHRSKTGGLITALRAVQSRYGYLPDAIETVAADIFNRSRAEVRGVISFYSDFSCAPKGETVVRLCAAEACQAAGGRALAAAVEKSCAAKMGETSPSGRVTLEPVYCLGLCSAAPAAIVNDRLIGLASEEKIEKAIEDASAARTS